VGELSWAGLNLFLIFPMWGDSSRSRWDHQPNGAHPWRLVKKIIQKFGQQPNSNPSTLSIKWRKIPNFAIHRTQNPDSCWHHCLRHSLPSLTPCFLTKLVEYAKVAKFDPWPAAGLTLFFGVARFRMRVWWSGVSLYIKEFIIIDSSTSKSL
jgi:hypothetical protein